MLLVEIFPFLSLRKKSFDLSDNEKTHCRVTPGLADQTGRLVKGLPTL